MCVYFGVGFQVDVFQLVEWIYGNVVIEYDVVFKNNVDIDQYIVVYGDGVMDIQVCWVVYVCVLSVQCMYCMVLLGVFQL